MLQITDAEVHSRDLLFSVKFFHDFCAICILINILFYYRLFQSDNSMHQILVLFNQDQSELSRRILHWISWVVSWKLDLIVIRFCHYYSFLDEELPGFLQRCLEYRGQRFVCIWIGSVHILVFLIWGSLERRAAWCKGGFWTFTRVSHRCKYHLILQHRGKFLRLHRKRACWIHISR